MKDNYERLNLLYNEYLTGNSKNFNELYYSLYKINVRVFGSKFRFSEIDTTFDDVFQDVMLKLLKSKPKLNGNIVTLVTLMFNNRFIDLYRSAKVKNIEKFKKFDDLDDNFEK